MSSWRKTEIIIKAYFTVRKNNLYLLSHQSEIKKMYVLKILKEEVTKNLLSKLLLYHFYIVFTF